MKFLGKLFKHIVISLALAAVGVSIGLFVLHYMETGHHFNPLDKAQRDWAQSRIRSAAQDAQQRFLHTKEGLEDWFQKQKEELPDTDQLLKRAIAYLEKEQDEKPLEEAPSAGETGKADEGTAAPAPPDFGTFETMPEKDASAKACPLEGPCETATGEAAPAETAAEAPTVDTKPAEETGTAAAETGPEEAAPAEVETAAKPVEAPVEAPAETPEAAAGPTVVAVVSAEERAATLDEAGKHFTKGKRHLMATMMPDRKDAVAELGKADRELRSAHQLLAAMLEKSPGDPDAEKMLAEVDGYIASLPEIGEVPEIEKPVEVASVPEKPKEAVPEEPAAGEAGDALATGEALDAAIGLSERPSSRLTDKQKLDLAKENFKKGLEVWRHSMSPQPNWLSNLNEATVRFEKAQSLLQEYTEKNPNDEEANQLFLDVNRFLYDCYKRTPARSL